MNRYITGLDIGSATIKVAVAEIGSGEKPKVVFLSKNPSNGIRKGSIISIDDIEKCVGLALEKANGAAKGALKNIFLNVGGVKNRTQVSKGMVVVSRADNEIFKDDIERVVKSAQDVIKSHNRVIIHNITRDFMVDGIPNIDDPTGLVGNRLEVESFIVDSFSQDVRNLEKAVEKTGGFISGMVFNPVASSQAVLTKNQKDLGVAMVDVGFGTTSLSVFEEGRLVHAAILPVGSANITNDLAIGLKIPVEAAENLKLSAGFAVSKEISIKDKLDLKKVDVNAKNVISKRFFSEIIEVRLAEILELVNDELKAIGKEKNLPAGIILVGGGSKIPGIVELAKQELKLSAQLGMVVPEMFSCVNKEVEEKIEDPEFSTSLGLILAGYNTMIGEKRGGKNPLSKVLNYFLP